MDFIKEITEYDSISIPHGLDDEEEQRRLDTRKEIWSRLVNDLKYPPYYCECNFETKDFKQHITHSIKCYELKTTTENVFKLMEKHDLLKFIREKGVSCKYCLKTFNDKRSGGKISLQQHLKRGKPFSCVNKAINEIIDRLDIDEKMSLLHKLRNTDKSI